MMTTENATIELHIHWHPDFRLGAMPGECEDETIPCASMTDARRVLRELLSWITDGRSFAWECATFNGGWDAVRLPSDRQIVEGVRYIDGLQIRDDASGDELFSVSWEGNHPELWRACWRAQRQLEKAFRLEDAEAEAYIEDEARELIRHRREYRGKLAQDARLLRRAMRTGNRELGREVWPLVLQLDAVRMHIGRRASPKAPTRRNLRREALANLRFSRERWENPLSTEYYSACGYDDYQAELRSGARELAVVLARARQLV